MIAIVRRGEKDFQTKMPGYMLAKMLIVFTFELWAAGDLKTSFEVRLPYAFMFHTYSAIHTSFALPVSLPCLSSVIIPPCTDIPCLTPAAVAELKSFPMR